MEETSWPLTLSTRPRRHNDATCSATTLLLRVCPSQVSIFQSAIAGACGENKSWSEAGRLLGFECVTLDWKCAADLQIDVRDFKCEGYYDIVCASPDCKELSNARSWTPGNLKFADSVAQACINIILHYVSLGATGILENPKGALERRDYMKQYDHLKCTVDYCQYSGDKPAGYEPTVASRQYLEDWFPYRKRTNIWIFGPNRWVPRPTCRNNCDFTVGGIHLCWAQHGPGRHQARKCRQHGLPFALTTAQLHRIPLALCTELLVQSMEKTKE